MVIQIQLLTAFSRISTALQNTSRGVSDSTHDVEEDDIDLEDIRDDSNKFKHIKQIDKCSQSGEGKVSESSSPMSRRMDKSDF